MRLKKFLIILTASAISLAFAAGCKQTAEFPELAKSGSEDTVTVYVLTRYELTGIEVNYEKYSSWKQLIEEEFDDSNASRGLEGRIRRVHRKSASIRSGRDIAVFERRPVFVFRKELRIPRRLRSRIRGKRRDYALNVKAISVPNKTRKRHKNPYDYPPDVPSKPKRRADLTISTLSRR